MYSAKVTIFLTIIISLCCQGEIIPCALNDDDCVLQSARSAYILILSGDQSLGVPSSDPLHVDNIGGKMSNLQYNYTNCIIKGVKDCNLQGVKLNMEELSLHIDMSCPAGNVDCNYIVDGQLLVLPVTGKGHMSLISGTYDIGADITLKKSKTESGTEHLGIKNFKLVHLDATNPVVFNATNLFNGQKDLADQFLNFVNENWKQVLNEFQYPLMTAIVKDIVKNVNKYLKHVPLDKMILS